MLPKIVYTYTGYRLYDFPVELVAEIKDSLTFPNPKYAAAAQYSKWGKPPKSIPRELWYYKMRCNYIEVPYGFEVNDFLPVNFEISERPEVRNKVTFSPFKLELRKTQQEAFNAYFDNLNKRMNFSQIILNTGKGKAQPLYSKIMTPNGYTLMRDIKVGDKVFDSKGNICRVIGIYPQGKKEVYELTFSDGSKVRSSDEHLWFVKTLSEYHSGKSFKVKTLKEIMNMDLKKNRAYNLVFPKNGAVNYGEVKHKIHPYVLGCIIGDGCMTAASKGIVYFSNTEQDVIKRLNEKLNEGYFDFNSSTQCQYQYRIKNNSKRGSRIYGTFIQEILKLGLNCKSEEKFIPKEYLLSSKENRIELLYGLFDTDGCVMPNGSFSFSTSSKQLSEDLIQLCRSLGIIASLRVNDREREGKSNEYIVCIRTHEKVFTSKKHNDRNEKAVLSHPRSNISKYDSLRLVDIKYIGEEDCQCIMVDSADHSYLTDDFVVTHNTVLGLAIAAKLSVRTLIIVHKSDLVKGWQEDIEKSLEMPVGIIQGNSQKVNDITIATVQTLNSRIKSGAYSPSFFKQFDLIIVDEAHHCPASTYDIINKFQARYRLGLTATPERNDGLTHVLNLFFGRPCYVYKSGVEDDDILPVKVFTRNVPLYYNPLVKIVSKNNDCVSIELADEFRKSPTAQDNRGKRYFTMSELRGLKIDFPPNFNRATMERNIVNHEVTFNEVLKDLNGEVDKGKSCILFFKQKEEVDCWFDNLSEEFYHNGKYCHICKYYGDNSDDENKRILEDIENGYYKITLATLAKCGEGTNCRAWESVFLISSIANGKDVEQAIGRARRIKRGKSDIVNVFDYRFPDVSGLNLRSHGSTRDERYKELNFDYPRKDKFSFSFGYPDKK